jgi:hypothetical protein
LATDLSYYHSMFSQTHKIPAAGRLLAFAAVVACILAVWTPSADADDTQKPTTAQVQLTDTPAPDDWASFLPMAAQFWAERQLTVDCPNGVAVLVGHGPSIFAAVAPAPGCAIYVLSHTIERTDLFRSQRCKLILHEYGHSIGLHHDYGDIMAEDPWPIALRQCDALDRLPPAPSREVTNVQVPITDDVDFKELPPVAIEPSDRLARKWARGRSRRLARSQCYLFTTYTHYCVAWTARRNRVLAIAVKIRTTLRRHHVTRMSLSRAKIVCLRLDRPKRRTISYREMVSCMPALKRLAPARR